MESARSRLTLLAGLVLTACASAPGVSSTTAPTASLAPPSAPPVRMPDAARVAPAIDRDGDGRKRNKRIEFTILVAWPRSEPQFVQRPESDRRVVVAGPRSAPRAPQ